MTLNVSTEDAVTYLVIGFFSLIVNIILEGPPKTTIFPNGFK